MKLKIDDNFLEMKDVTSNPMDYCGSAIHRYSKHARDKHNNASHKSVLYIF